MLRFILPALAGARISRPILAEDRDEPLRNLACQEHHDVRRRLR
jgi:hypothetical protein